jgi:hypothetical protein
VISGGRSTADGKAQDTAAFENRPGKKCLPCGIGSFNELVGSGVVLVMSLFDLSYAEQVEGMRGHDFKSLIGANPLS